MEEKRGPYREEHLALLDKASANGDCLLGGALVNPLDRGVIIFNSREAAERFVKEDSYVRGGLIKSWSVRDYMVVVGNLKDHIAD